MPTHTGRGSAAQNSRTGGFLLAALEYLSLRIQNARQAAFLQTRALHGIDLVPNVARLCAMNLFLQGIGTDRKCPVVKICDSLELKTRPVDMVLTNPPFGKKSSFTIISSDGKNHTDKLSYEREDFWATTSNKQLNFVQHVYSMLTENGRAAMVVPDNVLFEGGAGEKIRRAFLHRCEVHTCVNCFCCTSCNTFNRSRSRWLKVIRSVSMGASAIYESGHFYFAQTGHSHFAATRLLSLLTSLTLGLMLHSA
jgi:type I restriction-modification system DNA methylase subunit